jgi:hypothetical protein
MGLKIGSKVPQKLLTCPDLTEGLAIMWVEGVQK